jgi:uncharacterized protein (TIRG00374 family)
MGFRLCDPCEPGVGEGPDLDQPQNLRLLDRMKILRGVALFVILTLAALTLIFLKTQPADPLETLRDFDPGCLVMVLLLAAGDMNLGALRNHVFFMKLAPGLRYAVSFRANLANIFLGAVTPSQSGGGLAQLYVYHRAGISVGKSISVSVLNYLATLVFLVLAAGLSLCLLKSSMTLILLDLIIFCFAVFAVQLAFFVLVILKPAFSIRLIQAIANRFCCWLPRFESRIRRASDILLSEMAAYEDSCRLVMRYHPQILILSVLLTCALYLDKFCLAYFVMRGLGTSGPMVQVLCIQALVLFICYFSPSPGASGVAEVSIAVLMSEVMSENVLGIFSILQRFFLLYVPVTLGAVVLFREAGSMLMKKPSASGG